MNSGYYILSIHILTYVQLYSSMQSISKQQCIHFLRTSCFLSTLEMFFHPKSLIREVKHGFLPMQAWFLQAIAADGRKTKQVHLRIMTIDDWHWGSIIRICQTQISLKFSNGQDILQYKPKSLGLSYFWGAGYFMIFRLLSESELASLLCFWNCFLALSQWQTNALKCN